MLNAYFVGYQAMLKIFLFYPIIRAMNKNAEPVAITPLSPTKNITRPENEEVFKISRYVGSILRNEHITPTYVYSILATREELFVKSWWGKVADSSIFYTKSGILTPISIPWESECIVKYSYSGAKPP